MALFAIYLRNSTVNVPSFCGNRLNVIFWNTATFIYNQQYFNSFFEDYGTPNHFLRGVQKDLDETEFIACCRALCGINELVTGLYWWKCEAVENILDPNSVTGQIQIYCLQLLEYSSNLLFDQRYGFSVADIHKDNLYYTLFQLQNDVLINSL